MQIRRMQVEAEHNMYMICTLKETEEQLRKRINDNKANHEVKIFKRFHDN